MEDKWIPVSERVPEHSDYVWLFDSYWGRLLGNYRRPWGNSANYWISVIGTQQRNVTHWQPAQKPELPNAVEGE